MKKLISLVLVAALAGCASVHRSSSGSVTADYSLGTQRGAVAIMEASADLSANDAALDICREAQVAQRPCTAFDSRTGRPLVVVGGYVPSGAFGVGGSYLDQAAAIAEARRLQRLVAAQHAIITGFESDVRALSAPAEGE